MSVMSGAFCLVHVSELLHIFACEGKRCPKCAESISCHCTEFSHLGEQHLNLCTPVHI